MTWWKPTTWFRGHSSAVRTVRAKFDSAQTTPDNRRHWANADGLSADTAASPEVRRTLRNRARYEVANNSYARGIVLTLANDVIGAGPRLQMLLDSDEYASASHINGLIEDEFVAWCKAVDLPGKLRTMRMARAQDGEAFAVLFTNPEIQHPVKFDMKLIEADQVTTPTPTALHRNASGLDENVVDGIEFDAFGNPVAYHVLTSHPGSAGGTAHTFERVPAASMIHWFRTDRPGQSRGLPDILPALPLFAQLRKYTLAVVSAAESAANVAVFMKTNTPAGSEAADVEPMTEMEFTPNMAVFGPEGWEPIQIKAEVVFGEQAKPNGRPLGIPASILLVPTALKVPAEMLMKSVLLNENTTTPKPSANPHTGKFEVVSSVYLSSAAFTGHSSKAWYLLSDPNRLPAIEIAFLNGVDRPTVEKTDADFNTLGIAFRGYIDFGVREQDFRGALKMQGF